MRRFPYEHEPKPTARTINPVESGSACLHVLLRFDIFDILLPQATSTAASPNPPGRTSTCISQVWLIHPSGVMIQSVTRSEAYMHCLMRGISTMTAQSIECLYMWKVRPSSAVQVPSALHLCGEWWAISLSLLHSDLFVFSECHLTRV